MQAGPPENVLSPQFDQWLQGNKQAMVNILKTHPPVGVYQGQDPAHWPAFFDFFINFLKSEIGPRGQCSKAIRNELMKREEEVNQVLAPLKRKANHHIREIYMKYKFFVPCPEYTQMSKLKESRQKMADNIERLGDQASPMSVAISKGLKQKHGQDYDVGNELQRLKQNYIDKLKQSDAELQRLNQVLESTPAYHQLLAIEKMMHPYFNQWLEADRGIGRENTQTGLQFEEIVNNLMIPYLMAQQKKCKDWLYADKQLIVLKNVNWIPRNLGEIDIAFGYYDEKEDKYFICTLIECKSRLFDVREACRQVSLQEQGNLKNPPTLEELREIKKLKRQLQSERQEKKKAKKERRQAAKQQEGVQKQAEIKQEQLQPEEVKDPFKPQKVEQPAKQEMQDMKLDKKPSMRLKDIEVKKFLSTKWGPAEIVPNHHFYIITTLPQNQFVLPIESKMKETIEKHTKNMFLQDIESQALFKVARERFSQVLSPLDWFMEYEQKRGKQSNILVLS